MTRPSPSGKRIGTKKALRVPLNTPMSDHPAIPGESRTLVEAADQLAEVASRYVAHYGYPQRGIDVRLDELSDAIARYRAALAEVPVIPDELDVAWAEAEAAATALGYSWISLDGRFHEACQAGAFGAPLSGPDPETVIGPTPAAALRDLAARLAEMR